MTTWDRIYFLKCDDIRSNAETGLCGACGRLLRPIDSLAEAFMNVRSDVARGNGNAWVSQFAC